MENPNKSKLRQEYLEIRNRLDAMERLRASAAIHERIIGNPRWQDAGTILIYVSGKSEVDTQKIIQTALEQNKRLAVPVLDKSKKEMSFSELTATGDLQPGPYAWIYEPAKEFRVDVDPSEINLVLVPGIAFDRSGGRIGLGGGYFDKALAQMPQAYKIGVAFSKQVYPHRLPLDPHDISMNAIATETEWLDIAEGSS